MNRREWLKSMSALAVGALAGPSLLAVFDAHAASQAPAAKPQFFNPAQITLIGAVAEVIIPRTDTPGAVEAGVPLFIDSMFAACYTKAEQTRYLDAMTAFNKAGGKPFVQLTPAQQKALVTKLHAEAIASPKGVKLDPAVDFVMMNKKLTMLGFFLSQPGCTQVLQYDPVPAAWHADIPLSKAGNGKAWAVEAELKI